MPTPDRSPGECPPAAVLVVVDDPAAADVVATFLERADPPLAVTTATDADAALARLADGGVDCVVADFHLSRTDGLALLERCRTLAPDVGQVLYAVDDDPDLIAAAEAADVPFVRRTTDPDHYDGLADRVFEEACGGECEVP